MSPAIPVMPKGARHMDAVAFGRQGIIERGDHVYLQTPVQIFRPTGDQIEEYAFSKQVKTNAPNENLVWFKGQYVEADNPNGNGAQWRSEELGIKSLTPMLMPVTVMHDPRTAVGTIADVKLVTPEKDGVPRARIDTVLALWGHRFPEAVHEAEANAEAGTLMQSMECYSPWYECSECGQAFHKLPGGAEEAQWCDHLIASNPSAGYGDRTASPHAAGEGAQSPNASRILGDVCFTGTGLIFGTRGAKGAYDEAHLENFAEVLASHHRNVHTATASETTRSAPVGLVQIEQSELDLLRQERDTARSELAEEKTARQAAETATEAAEAAKVAAETERDTAKAEATAANENVAKAALKDKRMGALGEGFRAKLDAMPTVKARLDSQASDMSDEDWEARVTELEEATSTKRDAAKDGDDGDGDGAGNGATPPAGDAAAGQTFGREELARLNLGGNGGPPATPGSEPNPVERSQVVSSLAGAFKPKGD
jgi:hypothetical protein